MTKEPEYLTLMYTDQPKNGTFDRYPDIEGKKCVAVVWGDQFEDYDRAMSFIAMLADGQMDTYEAQQCAEDFFKGTGYESTYPCLIREDEAEFVRRD